MTKIHSKEEVSFNENNFMADMLTGAESIIIPVFGPYKRTTLPNPQFTANTTRTLLKPRIPAYVVAGTPDDMSVYVFLKEDDGSVMVTTFDSNLQPKRFPGQKGAISTYITPVHWQENDQIRDIRDVYVQVAQ